ncbi:MAG: formate dehydrogenase accessory sulfurtransferase FdhD [Pseudomonadales bacterium]
MTANGPQKAVSPEPSESLQSGQQRRLVQRWEDGVECQLEDELVTETAIAFVYNGISHAVMMASPMNLQDFALGFSLSESVLRNVSEMYSLSVDETEAGIQLNMEIASQRFAALKDRRRSLAGVSGCGLCGAESLQDVQKPVTALSSNLEELQPVALESVHKALADFESMQATRASTGAIHAAAWCRPDGTIACVREDLGRHNAVDKVVGALFKEGWNTGQGFLLLSSRISFEIVQKAAVLGITNIVAASAPSTLAVDLANRHHISLAGRLSERRITLYTDAKGVILS